MVEIYNKNVEHKCGTEWIRVTTVGDTETIEALHDFTGKLSEAEVIKRLNAITPTSTISSA